MDTTSIKAFLAILAILKKPLEWVKRIHQRSKNAAHDYNRYYKERHGQLKFSCLEMEAPISLEDVYIAVRFLDREQASQYGSFENIKKEVRQRVKKDSEGNSDKRQYGMIVANDEQYLMVLGDPGVGKSTFLRKVGLEVLKGEDGNFQHECTPVFLELKRFTENSVDIEALITHEFQVCGYPYPEQMTKDELKSGKLLVLFDGLDEVPKANVSNIISKIGDFVDRYSQNRFIASCRKAVNIGGFTQFTNVEVADFDDPQIKRYIKNWFASTSNGLTQRLDGKITTADLCWGMLNTSQHQSTKELVRNPLLLTLLCVVYDRSQDFPLNRTDLYKRIFNIFLEGWPSEKHVGRDPSVSQSLDVLDEVHLLSEVAAKNFEDNNLLFQKKELVDQIKEFSERNSITLSTFDARKILEAIVIDQGLFVERLEGVYSFLHLTFQEYLTANYFVSTQSIQKLVTEHLHDERWREVFLFAAELMPETDKLLLEMETEAAKAINTDGLKALFQWAKYIVNSSDNQGNRVAKPTFAVRQYFALWISNKICEIVKDIVNRYPHLNLGCDLYRYLDDERDKDRQHARGGYTITYKIYQDIDQALDQESDQDIYLNLNLCRSLHQPLYQHRHLDRDLCYYLNRALHGSFSDDLYQGFDIYQPLHQNLHHDIYETIHPDYSQNFKLYIYIYLYFYQDLEPYFNASFNLALDLYQDLYRYIHTDCYPLIFSRFSDRFERELDCRITFVEYMEQAEIFKDVDLQRVLRRFNQQQEFFRKTREGDSVEPPEESIHDTWISVLGITNDMLAVSPQEMHNYVHYLRAMKLILDCKKAARHVTPGIWQEIEDRLLVTNF